MKDDEHKHFRALTDVFINAIKKQDSTITETISRFFYVAFRKVRESSGDSPVIYPSAYYELVYKALEEFAILKNRKNVGLEQLSVGSVWLLGELRDNEISDKTYRWIWANLLLAIKYQQDDMILNHWATAHQYYSFNLSPIIPEYDAKTPKKKSHEAIEKREIERKQFLEFHFALGGLLTYKKRYKCIKRIFDYTTSQPPRYVLLPDSMDEVFSYYNNFRDPYDRRYSWISHKYPFPELDGMKADAVIKKWISSYFAILFLRQYTIYPYLITMKPLEYPSPPDSQADKKEWIDGLDFFKHLVEDTINNRELLDVLNFNFLTKSWCEENNKPYPLDFIADFKEKLNQAYESGAIDIRIDEHKKLQFYNTSKEILDKTFDFLQKLSSQSKIIKDTNSWFVPGINMFQSKDAFAENPEVHHIDFDSFLAHVLAERMNEAVSSTYSIIQSKAYLLKEEDLFIAIKNLGINKAYILINIGINLSHYIDYHKVPGLSIGTYNEIDIVSMPMSRIAPSLFLVKKADLPNILLNDIKQSQIDKYSLKKISEKRNIYASVIEIDYEDAEIIQEYSKNKSVEDLKKSVLLSLVISMEIRWKKNITMIQLIEYSEFRQKGLPNNLSDIKKIDPTPTSNI